MSENLVKLFTGDIENISEEHHQEQLHKFNEAIANGRAKPFSFCDSMVNKS